MEGSLQRKEELRLPQPSPLGEIDELSPGAFLLGSRRAGFRVWAPFAAAVELHLTAPVENRLPMTPAGEGWFHAIVNGIEPGARYLYRLDDGVEFPDPASRSQPDGVHAASELVEDAFDWTDSGWRGVSLAGSIFYELHVGTYTPEGTFDAAIAHFDYLASLGITTIEVMPVAQFPGSRNWGYDGVYPFAVQNSYGGLGGFKRFIDAAHRHGLAVVLDVVYNHLGPEGNYFGRFGPYFTDRYHTPWGLAINFDGANSRAVRNFVIGNAVRWVTEFHLDGLRLDAVHAIFDNSPKHILEEMAEAVHQAAHRLGRAIHVIAESDLNEPRLVESPSDGGYGLDAQWSDDFHHALHTLLTGERSGYYRDFGSAADLTRALNEGFVYAGQHSAHRGRIHGKSAAHIPPGRLVVCAQNHDQVGNRMLGDRFGSLLPFEMQKLAAGVVLLSPYLPLLFMGEEWGETAPFLYFVSHSDPDLIEAVRQGRRREFASFSWQGEVPDPQAESTFVRSRINHSLREGNQHGVLLDLVRELIALRQRLPAISRRDPGGAKIVGDSAIARFCHDADNKLLMVFYFAAAAGDLVVPAPAGIWKNLLESSSRRWAGPGSLVAEQLRSTGELHLRMAPGSFVLFQAG